MVDELRGERTSELLKDSLSERGVLNKATDPVCDLVRLVDERELVFRERPTEGFRRHRKNQGDPDQRKKSAELCENKRNSSGDTSLCKLLNQWTEKKCEEYSEDKGNKDRLELNEEEPKGAEREELRGEVLSHSASVALSGALRWSWGE